jgi:hypothetical protein
VRVRRQTFNAAALRPMAARCRMCGGRRVVEIVNADGSCSSVTCPWGSHDNPHAGAAPKTPACAADEKATA